MGYEYALDLDAKKSDIAIATSMFSIAEKFQQTPVNNIFVAGCGDGTEAAAIRNTMRVNVVAVDSGLTSEYEDDTLKVLNRDLMNLEYPDKSFDLIYSYHVLEHVPDPGIVLNSFSNMLVDKGLLVVGFPNRSRILGYLGAAKVTLKEKIMWNIADYKYRIKGKFQNKYGAHAGFTQEEFEKLASPFFNKINCVSDLYFLDKYSKKKNFINFLIKTRLSNFFYPSIYFICEKVAI